MVNFILDNFTCSTCGKHTLVLLGPEKQCRPCYSVNHNTDQQLDAFEQVLQVKEEQIADLQTIILLMDDIKQTIQTHTKDMATNNNGITQ